MSLPPSPSPLPDVTSLPQEPRPQLDPDNPEDEEDEEAEEEDVAEHGQGVQQQHHQDPHAGDPVDGLQRSQHPHSPDGGEVEFLHVHEVLQGPRDDDEAVQLVPGLMEVAAPAHQAQGDHLDQHLQGKVDVDQTVRYLKIRLGWEGNLLEDPSTVRKRHFLLQWFVSAHGLYIPSVTQLIRITVMVSLSNQLEIIISGGGKSSCIIINQLTD